MKTELPQEISAWSNTAAQQVVPCPRCNKQPGEVCRAPSGRRNYQPHTERTKYYREFIGIEEFERRHTIKFVNISDLK